MFLWPLSNAIDRLISSWLLMLTSLQAFKPGCLIGNVFKTEVLVQGQSWYGLMCEGGGVLCSPLFINLREILEVIMWSGEVQNIHSRRTGLGLLLPHTVRISISQKGATTQLQLLSEFDPKNKAQRKSPECLNTYSGSKDGLSMDVLDLWTVANGLMGWSWTWNKYLKRLVTKEV